MGGVSKELPLRSGSPSEGTRATILWYLPGVRGEMCLQRASALVTQRRRPACCLVPPPFVYLLFNGIFNPPLSDRICLNNAYTFLSSVFIVRSRIYKNICLKKESKKHFYPESL